VETRLNVKVYYEDTDCMGVVYHANYLKYFERGRTDWIGKLGRPILDWNREGYNFAVYKMLITFRKSARLGDELEVVTDSSGGTDFRKKMVQKLLLQGEVITEVEVDLVCLDSSMTLRDFPPGLFP